MLTKITKEIVADLYINQNKSITQISKDLEVDRSTLISFMARNEITKEDHEKQEKSRKYYERKSKYNYSGVSTDEY